MSTAKTVARISGDDVFLSVGVIAALSTLAWCVVIAPMLSGGILVAQIAVGFVVLSCLAWGILRARSAQIRYCTLRTYWPAVLAAFLGAGLLTVSAVRAEWMPSWVLGEDMVWNTAQSLFIHEDGGVLPEVHPNPAPLTNALFALSYGPSPSLATVFRGHAIVIIGLSALSGLVGGLLVARNARQLHPVVRVLLVFAAGWLPFTTLLLDSVLRMGHANVLTSYLLLCSLWVVYSAQEIPWTYRLVLLMLGTTALAASWAPLIVIPIGLIALTFFEARRSQVSMRGWKLVTIVAIATIQLGLYGVLITLPDLKRDGDALTQAGGMPSLGPSEAVFMYLVLGLVGVLSVQVHRRGAAGWRAGAGTLTVILVSLLAVGYLVFQLVSSGNQFWSYYPVKLISLVISLLVIAAVSAVALLISPKLPLRRQFVLASFAALIYLVALFTSGAQWTFGAQTTAPVLSAAVSVPNEAQKQATADLVAIYDAFPDDLSVVAQWNDGNEMDINRFLIQLSAERSTDPVRNYAYFFHTDDPVNFCQFLMTADRPVTVYTQLSEQEFAFEYLAVCDVDKPVVVRNEVPGGLG